MGLLLTSDLHREALIKVLNEVKFPEGIAVDKLGHVVNEVLTLDQISFSPEELGEEGIQHTKPLFIVVKCNEKLLPGPHRQWIVAQCLSSSYTESPWH